MPTPLSNPRAAHGEDHAAERRANAGRRESRTLSTAGEEVKRTLPALMQSARIAQNLRTDAQNLRVTMRVSHL